MLDEPWEGLDPDATRWLSATLEAKRDRGAAVVLSSHRLHDLAGVCDKYLFLTGAVPTLVRAHDIARSGLVSAEQLIDAFDRARDHATAAIALTDGRPAGLAHGGRVAPWLCRSLFDHLDLDPSIPGAIRVGGIGYGRCGLPKAFGLQQLLLHAVL